MGLIVAVQQLHSANIAHRDISLENILLDEGAVKLIDFSQAVPISDNEAHELRYFVAAGKDSYRAPEASIPFTGRQPIKVICPQDGQAGSVATVSHEKRLLDFVLPDYATAGRICVAQPCGYRAAPIDVFACGACFFAM